MTCDHEAQIRELETQVAGLMTTNAHLEAQLVGLQTMNTEKAAEIRRLRMGNHPAGRALLARADLRPYIAQINADATALAAALTELDADHEGGAS